MSVSVPTAPPWLPLPIDADEGFPQSFRLALDTGLYRVGLYVNVSEELLETLGSQALLELPQDDAFLVLRIAARVRRRRAADDLPAQGRARARLPRERADDPLRRADDRAREPQRARPARLQGHGEGGVGMGFVIWYRVIVSNGALPLVTVSNDVFGGQYTLDADIEVPLYEGDLTAEFRIKITDLPAGIARTVKAAAESGLRSREPVTADVYLGYFDARRPAAVVHGAITSVRTNVTAGKLVTELRGTDLAAWKLLQTRIDFHREGRVTPEAAVSYVLDQADVSQRGTVAIGEERTNYTLTASTGIAALGEISRWARCRFAVRDNEVAWQSTPLAPGLPAIPEIGPPLLKGENLVSFSDELSGEAARTRP